MFDEYSNHNLFLKGMDLFLKHDPHLSPLSETPLVHPMDWWRKIDWQAPGIYLLTGGRQIGKTTSTKLLLKELLVTKRFPPQSIYYLPCDQIDTHIQLGQKLRLLLKEISRHSPLFLLVLDEVTFVKDWDRAIKALADEGWFRRGFCIITGSDNVILKEAASRFPGRRGEASQTDFHLHPLTFFDYVRLIDPNLILTEHPDPSQLLSLLKDYFQCGGHLKTINDFHKNGSIKEATYITYEQWIQGDMERRGKSLSILLGVLKTVRETLGSQVTYSSLAQRMGEISKETFIDYCNLLERMDVLFTLQAFDQNKKIGFPKKARKIHFWDPFIMNTVERWLHREGLWNHTIENEPIKAESVVAGAFKLKGPTYYWKGKGEIDVIAVQPKQTLAIEVKWTKQLKSWDLSELKKHPNSIILTQNQEGANDGIPILPMPQFLIKGINPRSPGRFS